MKAKKLPFRFQGDDQRLHIYCGDEYLGSGEMSFNRKEFVLTGIGHDYPGLNIVSNYQHFSNKEEAATFLWLVHETAKVNPLSEEMRDFLHLEWRALNERRQHILGEFFELQRKRRSLFKIAKENQLEFDDDDTDIKKEVADLKNFMDNNNDAMYEHLGKDFARSLRAYVASVVRLVDPEVAGNL